MSKKSIIEKTRRDKRNKQKKQRAERKERTTWTNDAGFLYVLEISDSNWKKIIRYIRCKNRICKIGIAKDNPNKRLDGIQRSFPFGIVMNQMHFCEDRYLVERNLHKHFKNQHLRGEWFILSTCDLRTIKRLINKYDTIE